MKKQIIQAFVYRLYNYNYVGTIIDFEPVHHVKLYHCFVFSFFIELVAPHHNLFHLSVLI